MNQENEKKQMIADLYVLRAGLSAISQSTDLIKGNEEESAAYDEHVEEQKGKIKEIEEKIKSIEYKIDKQEERIKEVTDNVDLRIADINRQIDEKQNKFPPQSDKKKFRKARHRYMRAEYDLKEDLANYFTVCILIPIGFCATLIGAVIGIPWLIGGILVFLGRLIWRICAKSEFISACNENKEYIDNLKVEIDNQKQRIEEEIEVKEDYIKELTITKNELKNAQAELENLKNERVGGQQYCLARINEEAVKSNCVYVSLKNTYGGFISESDWQNIDLVIFYLQSGRADSLKEALQQADQQRQTDAIVNAIDNARRAISMEISSGMQMLGTVMVKGIEYLSGQIQSSARLISGAVFESTQAQRLANENLGKELAASAVNTEKLLAAVNLNNSLQQKANETSDQLLFDLRYNQQYWVK